MIKNKLLESYLLAGIDSYGSKDVRANQVGAAKAREHSNINILGSDDLSR